MTPAQSTSNVAAEAIDLDQFEDVQISTVVLKNPTTGAPTTSTISIMGPEHPARKKITLDRARKNRTEFQRTGKVAVTDPLDDIDSDTDMMVACTTDWTLQEAGAPLPFSPEAARVLYTDPKRQWLRAQVRKAMEETDRFIGNSTKA